VPAIVLDEADGGMIMSAEARDGRVTRLFVQMNPAKVADLDRPIDLY
jgi:proline racemase